VRSDWEQTTLGEIVSFKGGGTPSTEKAAYWNGDIPWVSPKDMKSSAIGDSIDKITAVAIENSAALLIPKDAILIVVRSGILARTIPVGITTRPLAVNQDIKALCPQKDVDPRYLHYFMQMSEPDILRLVTRGATVHRLSTESLKALRFAKPSLPEQQRIVVILDEAFAGLAVATANAEKNLKNARELFDSYLKSVFRQDWDWQPLGDICENLDSKRIPVTKRNRKSGNIPYYGASGPVDYVDDFIFDDDLLLVSEDGANLVMRTYPIAFSISGKSWVNNHAHVLRFADLASQKFVEYFLNSISLTPYVSGMAQPKLNQKALNSIPVPFPPLKERAHAVNRLDELATQTERLRDVYETRFASFAELKQSILQKAFSGELTSPPSKAIKEAAE